MVSVGIFMLPQSEEEKRRIKRDNKKTKIWFFRICKMIKKWLKG